MISPELRRKLRVVGPYCPRCRTFVLVEQLQPLKRQRQVKPEADMRVGEEVGLHWCGQSCFYLLEDR